MKTILALLICTLAMSAAAQEWRIEAPPDWTAETDDAPLLDVVVDSWFTEGDAVIASGVFVGPLAPGELRPLVGGVFPGSGRTICAHATAERSGQPSTRVSAVPACSTFPLYELLPPVLHAP